MLNLFKSIVDKWAHWVGDRDMELAIRNALTRDGLRGRAARISKVRLVAVQRPGWLQVYSFDAVWVEDAVETPSPPVFGLVRQDERYNRTEVKIHTSVNARNQLLRQWSEGLTRLGRH